MVDVDQIERVYSGRLGRCMCGCSGRWGDSDRSKKIIAGRVLNSPDVKRDGNIAYLEDQVKGTIRAVYFIEKTVDLGA